MNYYETQHGKSITNDKTITSDSKGQYAMDAYQLNPTEKGTLAYDLARKLDALDGAAAHNGIFRGKDITDLYQSGQLWTDIADGSFRNEYIGDYFDINISTEYTANEAVRCILGMFDPYLHTGDTPLEKHHVLVVPKNCFTKKHPMNPTRTTKGGFIGSEMWVTILPKYATALRTVFGEHLLKHRALLTNAINADSTSNAEDGLKGASSSWIWCDRNLGFLSEIHVCGSNICSSSYYDTGCDNLQLPIFALDPSSKICSLGGIISSGRQGYWLKNVASAYGFSSMEDTGYSTSHSSDVSNGVRPFWLIG